MKCNRCGGTQFRQEATLKLNVEIIVDEDGKFCDFVGDLNDQANESNITDRDDTFVCTECEREYEEE